MNGIIEIDETYIGGKARNKHQDKKPKNLRGTDGKQAVFGMRQRGGKTIAKPIPETDRGTLQAEIAQNVEQGSILYTDDHGAYRDINPALYHHEAVNHSTKEYVKGMAHTNGMESVWAVLKRSLVGTYHHVSGKHLQQYVNEATFRLNDGHVETMLMDRIGSLCRLSLGTRLPYAALTQGPSAYAEF